MIGAILRAQLLSMRLRRGSRRASAVFSGITGLLFYGFWAFLGWLLLLLFANVDSTSTALPLLSAGMALMTLYWQLAPVISASFGASLDLRKLLAYPIPHNRLFLIEILLRITACAEMLILISEASIGLVRNPIYGWRAAPLVASGAVLFIAMNILLAAGLRNWLERVILRTRLREVFVFLMVMISIAPQFLLVSNMKKTALLRYAPSQFVWPWASMAHLMLRDSIGLHGLLSLAWVAAAFVFSRRQFEVSLHFDGASAKRAAPRSTSTGLMDTLFRLPSRFLPDPIAALAEKELRTLTRVPRFRLAYLMSCFLGIVIFLPALRRGNTDGFFIRNALPIMALYGLMMLGQLSYWNAFGFDRSAVQGYFCWPIRFRDALIAKNLTVVMLLMPQVLAVSLTARLAHIPVSPGKIFETIAVIVIASLYWFALGNICSVRIPRPMDPEKMNQMSNKMQALTIWAAPFLLLPLALAYWARSVFESEIVFAAALAIAAAAGGAFYYVGLDSAATTAIARRETMMMELSRADGPMSIT